LKDAAEGRPFEELLAFSTSASSVVVYEPEHLYDQALANERNAI